MKQFYFFLLFFPVLINAQPKAGYYDAAVGKADAALKTALFSIISTHTERSYANLWTDFQITDKRADGKVWDMYSNCNFTFGTHQDSGSGGSSECQYYNREHSFPKSWFNDGYPMYTDLFHLYPTDKYVNNQRGNYPFGETSAPSDTYLNGSKRGNSTFTGYSGIIFEPIDEYKGDFARTYLYMVTAYENKISSWSSEHLSGSSYTGLNIWSVNLLLKWHRQDPVSPKEINRNNAVEGIQHNRNPFIDYPLMAEHIWGTQKGILWSFTSGFDELKIEFSVWPNPVQDVLNIKTDEQNYSCVIYNINGQQLIKEQLNGGGSLNVNNLENGMYLIRVQAGSKTSVNKFIVNK